MPDTVAQTTFTRGEIAPALHGRIDLAQYYSGLKTCKNFIVRQYGGISNRPGSEFCTEVKDSSKQTRLIPFIPSTSTSYVLEVGNLYIRVIKDGSYVLSGGTPVEIVAPWLTADLPYIKITQSNNVMTICCPGYAVRQLSQTSDTSWTLSTFSATGGPFLDQNITTTHTVTPSAVTGTITLTASSALFVSGHVGALMRLEQMPNDTIERWEVDTAYSALDVVRAGGNYYKTTAGGTSGTVRPTVTEGSESDGAVVWKYLHSGYGIVQITAVTDSTHATATVISLLPDALLTTASYKWALGAWSADSGYPSTSTYHQQRQYFGASTDQPQTFWGSESAAYTGFSVAVPSEADDAITYTIAANAAQQIRHFVPLSTLLILTSGGVMRVNGGSDGVITPDTISVHVEGYEGASHLQPVIIGSDALFVTDRSSVVKSLAYSFESDAFRGSDLTVLSSHLFQGQTIVDMAHARIPFGCLWLVRGDGVLLGLTYLREHDVVGWHRHETDGLFESIAVVPEGNEDSVYVIVQREIDGSDVRYIERFKPRIFTEQVDAFFVDSGLTYDGRNTSTTTITLTGGTAWDHTETLTATASASTFAASNVGDRIDFEGADGIKYRFTIYGYTSGTVVTGMMQRELESALRGVAFTDWTLAVDSVAGLDHLEGKTVAVCADGMVQSDKTVASGAITLDTPAGVIHVGLPYTAEATTLPLSSQQTNIRDKHKIIPRVTIICEQTSGLKAGPDADNLMEYKQRSSECYDCPDEYIDGLVDINVLADWNKNGQITIVQDKPLPATILTLMPEVEVGGA